MSSETNSAVLVTTCFFDFVALHGHGISIF